MFEKFLKFLRGLGTIGGWAANVLQFLLSSYPGLTMSAILAAATAYFNSAIEWIQQPTVYVSAGVFLFVLWTYIGLTILRARREPQFVRTVHDYAYGLVLEGGPQISFGKFENSHPTNPNGDAVMIGCNYRNVSAGPLRLKLEEFRVILNNRTNDDINTASELVFARLAAMGIRSGGVPINYSDRILSGRLVLKFVYGHPDDDYVRKYTLKLNIHVTVDLANNVISISDDGVDIKDEPYVVR